MRFAPLSRRPSGADHPAPGAAPFRAAGRTTISTISRRRPVHNAGLGGLAGGSRLPTSHLALSLHVTLTDGVAGLPRVTLCWFFRCDFPRITGGGTPKIDGFVKSPSVPRGAGLRFIFRHCSVSLCTPHSSRFARLVPPVAGELFTVPSPLPTFYEVINLNPHMHETP